MKLCNACFEKYDEVLEICPFCGYELGDPAEEPYFLQPSMVLQDRYIVGKVLGFGGFGITYKAYDKNLDAIVAVKEYYYSGIAARNPGTQAVMVYAQARNAEYRHFLNRFIDEARYTAKFNEKNNIVNVFDFFEENNTAYMVMEFLEGTTLSKLLEKGRMSFEQGISTILEVCSAVMAVHMEGILHRDISPDNIMLCADGKVKLLDFGAARFTVHEDKQIVKLTQVMKPGFSPPEQYQTISKQGSWTDIYALGATLYYMLTGTKPVESTNRKAEDTLVPPIVLNPDLPEIVNDIILRAMAIDMHLRFVSVDELMKALNNERKVLSVEKEKKRRRKNRWISAISAVIAVTIGFSIFYYNYNQQRLEETLPDSEIEFWFSLPENDVRGTAKTTAYQSVINIFNESFPNVIINLVSYPEQEYAEIIANAAMSNELPSLFESTGLDESVLKDAQSVKNAINTIDLKTVLFFNEYSTAFPDAKKFPLGFAIAVRFINKTPYTNIEATDDARETFLLGGAEEYIGTTADYYDVQQQRALAGRYEIELILDNGISREFRDMLSIGNTDRDQIRVVNRFLVFMLSENAQDYLHIQYQSGSLPLNRSALFINYLPEYDELRVLIEGVLE